MLVAIYDTVHTASSLLNVIGFGNNCG